MTKDELQVAVNDSGFPLQLGLKLLANTPRWQVLLSEHPWRDPMTDSEKFIDLVVNERQPGLGGAGFQTLVIECKRARETAWIFLREKNDGNRVVTRARVVAKAERVREPSINDWMDVHCIPGSPMADFCVVRKPRRDGQVELIERTASEIVRATHALAEEELAMCETHAKALRCVYVPMIVTTAALYICDADYLDVDFDTGEIGDCKIERVPFVRFTKSLSAGGSTKNSTSLVDTVKQSERSVIVAQAPSMTQFLEKWDLGNITTELRDALFH
jgi:hypothetical protein